MQEQPQQQQPAPKYSRHLQQIPVDESNYTREIDGVVEHDCEVACNAEAACIGFTTMITGSACWLYSSAPTLKIVSGAEWWQKPGTKPIPAPPVPPPPPPPPAPPPVPPELACRPWKTTTFWTAAGCAGDGSNCLLDIQVTSASQSQPGRRRSSSGAAVVSWSTLPFVPPKHMHLPNGAVVTVAVAAEPTAGQADHVKITLTADATALYVVLTTSAQGRFSDNVLTVRPGIPAVVDFISWDGPLNKTGIARMQGTLRVEHLADNL